MPGLSLGLGGGLRAGGSFGTPAAPASQVAPAAAAFGSGTSATPNSGVKFGPGHLAITAGLVAGALIGLTWWAQPPARRNEFGSVIFTIGVGYVFFSGVRQWGRIHIAEGDTNAFYKAAAIL